MTDLIGAPVGHLLWMGWQFIIVIGTIRIWKKRHHFKRPLGTFQWSVFNSTTLLDQVNPILSVQSIKNLTTLIQCHTASTIVTWNAKVIDLRLNCFWLKVLADFVKEMCQCAPPQYEKLFANNTVKKCSLYQHISCLKPAYTAFKAYRPKVMAFSLTSLNLKLKHCLCKYNCNRFKYVVQDIQYGYHWLESDTVRLILNKSYNA